MQVGARVRARLTGEWAPATIRAAFPDGTYKVELDTKQISFMPYWYGVTREELALEGEDVAGRGGGTYLKLYWNQTRHGGRDPASVARAVTADDAVVALGADPEDIDPTHVVTLAEVSRKYGVTLPRSLERLVKASGAGRAVNTTHPNNPVPVQIEAWTIRRGLRARGVDGEHGLVLVEPHQGDHRWIAVFDDAEADARMYAYWGDDDGSGHWALTSPTLGFFFWDQAQTGLNWWKDSKVDGGPPIRTTDIGLAVDRRRF